MALWKKVKMLSLLLLFVTLLAGCGQEEKAPQKGEQQQLKIGVLPIEDVMPIVVADENGDAPWKFSRHKLFAPPCRTAYLFHMQVSPREN